MRGEERGNIKEWEEQTNTPKRENEGKGEEGKKEGKRGEWVRGEMSGCVKEYGGKTSVLNRVKEGKGEERGEGKGKGK